MSCPVAPQWVSGCLWEAGGARWRTRSPLIWEQVASQGDITAWSMARSPQLTVPLYRFWCAVWRARRALIVRRMTDSFMQRGSTVGRDRSMETFVGRHCPALRRWLTIGPAVTARQESSRQSLSFKCWNDCLLYNHASQRLLHFHSKVQQVSSFWKINK